MRLTPHVAVPLLFTASLLLPSFANAQVMKCAVQPAAPVTPADTAYIAGDQATAETTAASQLGSTPSDAAYATLVRIQLERNELPAALETAKKAVAANPASAPAQALVGDANLRGGDVPAASAAYIAALKLDPCSPRAHLGHARINDMVGRHTNGAAELHNAHGLAPKDPEITLYWLESLPSGQKGSALRALLDSSPVLPPEDMERVQNELTIIEQGKLCTPVEAPAGAVKLDIAPILYDGQNTRSWGMQVRLNNKSTSLLELDSSIDGIVLNPKDADKAGVRPLTKADPTKPYMGFADSLKIGKLEYRNCPVRVVPAAMLANANSLIGTAFFRDHLIHIDYVDKSVTLRPLPALPANPAQEPVVAAEEKDWSPVYVVGANVLIPTMIDKRGPFLFVMDTGLDTTVFAPAVMPKILGRQRESTASLKGSSAGIVKVLSQFNDPDSDHTLIRGADGEILQAYTPFKVPVLHFTNNVRSDIYSIAFDITPKSHQAGTEISGVIGFTILYDFSIDINYRDSLVQVLLDQNHRYAAREGAHLFGM